MNVTTNNDVIDGRWAGLMAAAQRGDSGAYMTLLRECVPFIRAVAGRQGVEMEALDDVVQEVLITLHRVRATYDPMRSYRAWLSAITQRRAIDLLRRKSRLARREVHAPLAYEGHVDPAVDIAAQTENRAGVARIVDALDDLPDSQREAVEHITMRGLSLEEAADKTGRSKGALKVNLHRALKNLRARFSGEG